MIHPPQVRPEEPIAVTPHDGICGGESQQWLSYPTNPHVRFDERGRETERCRMAQATAPVLDSTTGSPSGYVRGPNSLDDDLCTAPRGRLPSLISSNARLYPRDSAGSADRAPFWAQVACQVPRWCPPPTGSTSRHRPWPQAVDHLQNAAEQITRQRHLGHLEHRVAGVSDHLRANLHNLLAKRGQRPAFDLVWQHQRAEEVGQVVGQSMKLKPHRVGLHRPARQPCPPDRILTLSDPLLRRAALIVKGDHPLGRAAQVGHQEAHPWIEFTRMRLDLGYNPA